MLCLKRQQELLLQRQEELSTDVAAAAQALNTLRAQRTAATHDLELHLLLKSGQVLKSGQANDAHTPHAVC